MIPWHETTSGRNRWATGQAPVAPPSTAQSPPITERFPQHGYYDPSERRGTLRQSSSFSQGGSSSLSSRAVSSVYENEVSVPATTRSHPTLRRSPLRHRRSISDSSLAALLAAVERQDDEGPLKVSAPTHPRDFHRLPYPSSVPLIYLLETLDLKFQDGPERMNILDQILGSAIETATRNNHDSPPSSQTLGE